MFYYVIMFFILAAPLPIVLYILYKRINLFRYYKNNSISVKVPIINYCFEPSTGRSKPSSHVFKVMICDSSNSNCIQEIRTPSIMGDFYRKQKELPVSIILLPNMNAYNSTFKLSQISEVLFYRDTGIAPLISAGIATTIYLIAIVFCILFFIF